MNQIPRLDWLPGRASYSDTAWAGFPVLFPPSGCKKVFYRTIFSVKIWEFLWILCRDGTRKRENESENKENKNVDEFQESVLQEKLANTKVKTQSDIKAWNVI